jgi:hypothetical protein
LGYTKGAKSMANVFSSICQMNLVSPPQPCSSHRTHRIEFQFSDNSRRHFFVCERHAANVGAIEQALLISGEFPVNACLVATSTRELNSMSFASSPMAAIRAAAPAR